MLAQISDGDSDDLDVATNSIGYLLLRQWPYSSKQDEYEVFVRSICTLVTKNLAFP
jgi:hypothetical protein